MIEIWGFIVLILSVISILILTAKIKVNPFLSMIVVAFIFGIISGLKPLDVIEAIKIGFGNFVLKVGLIYLCGAIISVMMKKTGAIYSVTNLILKLNVKNEYLSIAVCGVVISVIINCDPGLLILYPIAQDYAKKKKTSIFPMAIALAIGLYSSHTLVPPTAGPLSASTILNADIGKVILFGLGVSLLSVIICCKILKKIKFSNLLTIEIKDNDVFDSNELFKPGYLHSLLPIAYPVIFIALKSFIELAGIKLGTITDIIIVLGEPTFALFIAVLLSFSLVKKENLSIAVSEWIHEALEMSSSIIFITAAGGAFANVINQSSVISFIENITTSFNIGLLFPFLIAAILKIAQGSTTVAIVTTAGIMQELIIGTDINPIWYVLAISSGAMFFSYTNDSYFWVFKELTKESTENVLKSYSIFTMIESIISFIIVYVCSILF